MAHSWDPSCSRYGFCPIVRRVSERCDPRTNHIHLPELHHYKNLLPGTTDARVHRPTKAPVSRLLRMPGGSGSPDGCHAPAIQHCVAGEGSMGSGAAGHGAGDQLAELACLWAADYQDFLGAAGASRYVVCLLSASCTFVTIRP